MRVAVDGTRRESRVGLLRPLIGLLRPLVGPLRPLIGLLRPLIVCHSGWLSRKRRELDSCRPLSTMILFRLMYLFR